MNDDPGIPTLVIDGVAAAICAYFAFNLVNQPLMYILFGLSAFFIVGAIADMWEMAGLEVNLS